MAAPDLSRRRFIATSLLAGTACLLRAKVSATETPFALRYVLGSSLYGNLPLTTVLAEVPRAGTGSLDLWAKVHGTQRAEAGALDHARLLELLQGHGVRVPMTTRYDLGPFQLQDEMPFVRGLGGRVIVTGAKGQAGLAGPALRREVRRFVEQLKPHLAAAAGHGITLAIENHGESLIESPDSIRWLAEYSQGLPLGLALAPYHLPQDAALIARLITDLRSQLTLLYAWQYGHGCMKPLPACEEMLQLPGRGPLDFRPILSALRSIHYEGSVEIFMHHTPRGLPFRPTATKVTAEINRAREYLDGLAASVAG